MSNLVKDGQTDKPCPKKNHFFAFQSPYSRHRTVTHFYLNVSLQDAFNQFLEEKGWSVKKYQSNKKRVFVMVSRFSEYLKLVDDIPICNDSIVGGYSMSFKELVSVCKSHNIPVI